MRLDSQQNLQRNSDRVIELSSIYPAEETRTWTLLQNNSRSLIGRKFEELRERRESALIAYLTANDPSPEAFRKNCNALVEGGADILEIGMPFSDPIADGPVIQASSSRAL